MDKLQEKKNQQYKENSPFHNSNKNEFELISDVTQTIITRKGTYEESFGYTLTKIAYRNC